ncbi:uncharacterized protein LOC122884768 isoform X1 [Siniperca chuatsi]|uniref:uncharacterized protein LOC122884768 isoform X1 n=1 Tax=Siniperca chuatsi TaxID=119488 RepID=UPI001CE11260|nr:uncharacterized protein LOC122884768 isoform X1 [Siniperca chuatsi]
MRDTLRPKDLDALQHVEIRPTDIFLITYLKSETIQHGEMTELHGDKVRQREERKSSRDKTTVRQRPWLFSEMNINNMMSHNRSTEIREITSIVLPSPTDTDRSGEGRIRRIEEHNLAAHHAPLFKIHNGLWSSAMPFKCVLC